MAIAIEEEQERRAWRQSWKTVGLGLEFGTRSMIRRFEENNVLSKTHRFVMMYGAFAEGFTSFTGEQVIC